MLGIGAIVGVALILLDAALGAMNKLRIPPLAVGIGIYLPMGSHWLWHTFGAITTALVIEYFYLVAGEKNPSPPVATGGL